MNHDEATQWIFDLRSGKLPADLETPVLGHVGECATCRRMLEVFDSLATASAHPDADALVRYAADSGTLGEAERASLDSHCLQCASCARQAQAVRDAEQELASSGASGATNRLGNVTRFPEPLPTTGWRRISIASMGVAAMLLVSFGYIAFWSLPEARHRIDALQRGLESLQSGPSVHAVNLPLLGGALRDGTTMPSITIPEGGAVVPLAVAPSLPRTTDDAANHRFEIFDAGQRSVFSLGLTAAEIREMSRDSDVLALLVPGTAIDAGTYRLILTDLEQDVVLLDRQFRVIREEVDP